MQQLSQELGGELGHPAGEEGHRKELVGTQTRFQGSRQVSNRFLHPTLDMHLVKNVVAGSSDTYVAVLGNTEPLLIAQHLRQTWFNRLPGEDGGDA